MLTGKCKEAFVKWFDTKYPPSKKDILDTGFSYRFLEFIDLYFSMRYGVYLEFFDSVEIYIEVSRDYDWTDFPMVFNGWVYYIAEEENNKWYGSRQEAQIEAIKKANDIFNAR